MYQHSDGERQRDVAAGLDEAPAGSWSRTLVVRALERPGNKEPPGP
ncbi:hypothetical protein ACIG3E_04860 [Streptomyces sp. NPDC053474]